MESIEYWFHLLIFEGNIWFFSKIYRISEEGLGLVKKVLRKVGVFFGLWWKDAKLINTLIASKIYYKHRKNLIFNLNN